MAPWRRSRWKFPTSHMSIMGGHQQDIYGRRGPTAMLFLNPPEPSSIALLLNEELRTCLSILLHGIVDSPKLVCCYPPSLVMIPNMVKGHFAPLQTPVSSFFRVKSHTVILSAPSSRQPQLRRLVNIYGLSGRRFISRTTHETTTIGNADIPRKPYWQAIELWKDVSEGDFLTHRWQVCSTRLPTSRKEN